MLFASLFANTSHCIAQIALITRRNWQQPNKRMEATGSSGRFSFFAHTAPFVLFRASCEALELPDCTCTPHQPGERDHQVNRVRAASMRARVVGKANHQRLRHRRERDQSECPHCPCLHFSLLSLIQKFQHPRRGYALPRSPHAGRSVSQKYTL